LRSNAPALCATPACARRRRRRKLLHKNKSTGPRTPEGKAIAARNAIKHGFGAANPVIHSIEDQESWDLRLDAYTNTLQPANPIEADAVRRAALAMWKFDRLIRVETTLFAMEFTYHTTMIDGRLVAEECSPIDRMAVAFKESAGDGAFDLCRRYIMSITREHDAALRTFYFLRSKRDMESATAVVDSPQPTENTRKPNELPRKPVPAASTAAKTVTPITIGTKPASKPASDLPIPYLGQGAKSMK
jgi:hypothetical protein